MERMPVDFSLDISRLFRKRFLDTHYEYLHSIAYIIEKMYGEEEDKTSKMISQLMKQKPKRPERKEDTPNETPEFRNLRNCWYNECALNYPFDSLDERMKFASWKIMQCYYTIFSAIASVVCCHYEEQHDVNKTLNLYANEFLRGEKKAFTLPPLNLFVNQQGTIPEDTKESITWKWGKNNCVPKIEECLSKIQEKNRLVAIPHYMRKLKKISLTKICIFFSVYALLLRSSWMMHLAQLHLLIAFKQNSI